jgi:SAM-dependent methyltransferase
LSDNETERERIRSVYRAWNDGAKAGLYSWSRPDVLQHAAAFNRVVGALLAATIGPDLGSLRALDVGCGTGGFLRQLIGWGAQPHNLAGTEYIGERLDQARLRTASGVHWHLGELDFAPAGSFDLVSANTVFSSILDESARCALAAQMWRMVKPGGACMVFDFRYDNPSNREVRRVSRAELRRYWPAASAQYRSLLLAPPIARRMVRAPFPVSDLLAALVPALRSHFVYIASKDR